MAKNEDPGPKGSESKFEETLREMWEQGTEHPFTWPSIFGGLFLGLLLSAPLGPAGFLLGGVFGALIVMLIKLEN